MLTARTKTIERTGTGRQFPPSLASLSATKFSLQIYMELLVLCALIRQCHRSVILLIAVNMAFIRAFIVDRMTVTHGKY